MISKNSQVYKTFLIPIKWIIIGILVVANVLFFSGFKSGKRDMDLSNNKSPVIMVCFSWSTMGIGDIGITPGLLNLLEQNIPEAEIIVVAVSWIKMKKI